MPGGEDQQSYEASRRTLDRQLSQRGLRARDLRVDREAARMWASQDSAARAADFASATAEVERLTALARTIPVAQIADQRLAEIDGRLGSSRSTVEDATLRALMATVPRTDPTREETRRFMARIDAFEQSLGAGP